MAQYVRKSENGDVRILSEEERVEEDRNNSKSAASSITAIICVLAYFGTVGLDTPMEKFGAIVVGIGSLVLGAVLHKFIWALVSFIIMSIVCLFVFLWVMDEKPAVVAKSEPEVISETTNTQTTLEQISQSTMIAEVEQPELESSLSQVDNSARTPVPTISPPAAVEPVQIATFQYKAIISKSSGKVVIQSGPSIFSKNVSSLSPGTLVMAESMDGKWIRIQTDTGISGFVKSKELEFQP